MSEKVRILYVDDESDLLTIGKRFLEKNPDFTVTIAAGAAKAIDLLNDDSYDAIISDYQMPGMDGIAFLKYLKSRGNTTPFILFTGKSREEVVIEALNTGADFYLQKGSDALAQFTELAHMIRSAVSRHRSESHAHDVEKQLFDIINFLPDATFAIDRMGTVIAWNRAMEEMTGISQEEMIGQGDHAYSIPFYGDRRHQLLDLIDTYDEEVASRYHSLKKVDKTLSAEVFTPALYGGKGAYVWATGSPLFDVHGNRVGAIESIRDITDRKRIEEAILSNIDELTRQQITNRVTEERLLMAQEIGQIGCWEYHIMNNTVWGSIEAKRIFGFSPEAGDFPIDEIEACIPDRARVHQALIDLLTNGCEYNLEYTIQPADGSALKVIHSIARLERDLQGDPLRVMGIIQDITLRKQEEEKFLGSEQKFREFFEGNRDGYVIVDTSGRFIDANQAYCTMLGYTLEELWEMENFYEITPERWRTWEEEEIWNKRLLGDGYSGLYEKEYIRKNGEIFPVELQCYTSYGKDGVVQYIWGVFRDITLRKQEEQERECLIADLGASNQELNAIYEELQRSEQEIKSQYGALASSEEDLRQTKGFLENLISIANVPIIVWDETFRIIRFNHASEHLIGRSREEVIGKPLHLLFPPEQSEESMRLIRTTQEGVRWETVELDMLHQDGSLRTLLWNSATLYTPDGITPIATIAQGRDITEERRLEQEKDATLMQIQKNMASLAVLNDEIRNPLAIITLCADTITNTRVTDQILREVGRIDALINQLDKRWMESEKVLTAIRSHYQLYVSSSVLPTPSEWSGDDQTEQLRIATQSSERKSRILIEEVQAQLYTILDSMDALVYVADMKTYELLFMNQRGRTLFGDSIGQKCYSGLHHNRDSPCPFCTNHLLVNQAGPTGVYKWEFQSTVTGRWYDCRDRAICWSDGRIVRLEIATDITERKRMEEALQESQEKFQNIFDLILDGVHIHEITPDGSPGRFVEVNDAAARMLQYTPDEMLKFGPLDVVTEYHNRPLDAIINELSTSGHAIFETQHRRKDGSIIEVEVNAHRVVLQGRPMSVSVVRDITERKLDEEYLNESNQKLRLLTSLTRHDTLNQVTAMQLLFDLILATSDPAKISEYIAQAHKAGAQIERTIGFTREYESFGMASSSWQQVFSIIESAKENVLPGDVTVKNMISPELWIYADPIIRKVFTTLMENAIRHGGKIANIQFSNTGVEDTLIISCEDDGFGVISEEKERIFDHGYGKHTGIGLFLSREILSITGLSIRETGEPGKGARFEILVPTGKWRRK